MECINRVNACERSSQRESISSQGSESGNAVAALHSPSLKPSESVVRIPSSATTSSNSVGTLHNSQIVK